MENKYDYNKYFKLEWIVTKRENNIAVHSLFATILSKGHVYEKVFEFEEDESFDECFLEKGVYSVLDSVGLYFLRFELNNNVLKPFDNFIILEQRDFNKLLSEKKKFIKMIVEEMIVENLKNFLNCIL